MSLNCRTAAGTAGSVVAARLSENHAVSVLVLEAGGSSVKSLLRLLSRAQVIMPTL